MRPPAPSSSLSSLRQIGRSHGFVMTSTLLGISSLSAQSPAPATTPVTKEGEGDETLLPQLVVEADGTRTLYKPEGLASKKAVQPLRDVAQTVTVIPSEVIREQNATSLRDVLRNVPGISMQAGEGGGGPAGDNLSIRGFAARSDIFVDGLRDTSSGGYSRDPFNLEQVEVTKGPASANSGRGSTGGSINIVTKSPKAANAYGLMLGGGSDDFLRTAIDVNQTIPQWSGSAVRLNAVYHDQNIPGRDEVENQRWGVAPSFAMGLGTDTRVTVSYMHLTQDNVPDYGIPWIPRDNPLTAANENVTGLRPGVPDVSFRNYYGNVHRDHENIRTDLLTGIIEHDFNEDLSLRTTLRYGRNDRDSVTTAPRFTTGTTLTRQFQSRDQVDTSAATATDIRYDFETGKISHKMVGGVEASRDESTNHTRVLTGANPTTQLFAPTPYDPFTGTISRNGAFISTESDTLAFYLFDTLQLDKHWEISGGLRWDSFDVAYDSRAADSAGGAHTRLDRQDEMLSYRAAVTYKPVREGSIYLGYGTSFNPSTEGLTYIAAPTGTNSTLSLFDADPEENHTLELGAKWELLDEKLLLSGALFQTLKSNARTVDPADPTEVLLTGEQEVRGVELGFTGSITDTWRIIGGYTWLDSEVKESAVPQEVGNEVSNTPDHSFSLWTVHDLPKGFQVGVGSSYVGSRFNNNNGNTRQEAPGYAVIDAMVGYRMNDHVSFRLNAYNLANKEYIDRVGGGHFVPGQARSVVLSADIQF